MYIPKPFEIEGKEHLIDAIETYNFASMVSLDGNRPFCTHLPFLYDREKNNLFGHMAANNPHCKFLEASPQVLIIFTGPHAYVSPAWYATENNVPTWNYLAVHVYGSFHFESEPQDIDETLSLSALEFEKANGTTWKYDSLSDAMKKSLFSAIRAFHIKIDKIQGKAKMGQNRQAEDIESLIRGLNESGHADVASLMCELNKEKLAGIMS